MKHKLSDLNEYLFDALDAITNDDLEGEELEKQLRKCEAVAKISETIIRNGELALKTMKTLTDAGYGPEELVVPEMLRLNGGD